MMVSFVFRHIGWTFRSLRFFNYRLWSAGALVSNIGTWMQRTAQDWLVLTVLTNRNATALGVVMALQFGPQLLLLPLTGLAADRLDQRRLLVATQAAMGVFAFILGILVLSSSARLWQVQALALLSGCAAAFDAPARQTYVSQLVGDADLPNAIALNATSFNAARMIGPALSGLTIASVGIAWAFLVNGLSFVAVLLSLLLLRKDELKPQPRASRRHGGFIAGLAYVRDRPDLRIILGMLAIIGTFTLNFPIFISTMAVKVLHTDARGYGLLSSALAFGTMTGAILGARRERPEFRTLLLATIGLTAGCGLAAVAPDFYLFGLTLAGAGIGVLTFTNTTNSLMQLSTSPEMRGRVLALRVAVFLGGAPLGAPIVGWVADHAGPRWALAFGAVAALAAALLGLSQAREVQGKPPA